MAERLTSYRERIFILLSLGKDKKATKSCFCLIDFVTSEKARQAIKMVNGTSASWGVLRIAKAKGWAATYPQKRSGEAEDEKKDLREKSSKG